MGSQGELNVFWRIFFILGALLTFNKANADEINEQTCAILLEADVAYIKQNIEQNGPENLISPEIGGPVDLLMADIFEILDDAYTPRIERKFTLAFVGFCNENGAVKVATAIMKVADELKLDMSVRNWGMKDIDTETLLNSTCQDFVAYIQAYGLGEMFYNDPAQVTMANYWAKFDNTNIDPNITELVEGDAKLACSWEPEAKLIDVLDTIAGDYKLQRVR